MTGDYSQGVPNVIHPAASPTPQPPGGKKGDKGSSPGTAFADVPVPEAIASRYVRVDNRYYFPDRTFAFFDGGDKLKARTHNTEVIRSLVTIAEARGWNAIQVTGSPQFRQSVWREATQRGIDVKGYDPSPLDRAAAQRSMHVPAASRRHDDEADRSAARTADHPQQPPQGSATDGTQRITGRLLEAGPAHYKFDKRQRLSYFVRLGTEQGERTLWGLDLEHALIASKTGVKVGDTVSVEKLGSKPVSVEVPKRDEQGRVTGYQHVDTHRNAWRIEHPSFFEEQANKAAAFRDHTAPRQDLVRRHPDLANAVVGHWLAEQFAAKSMPQAVDRDRAVHFARERIATAVERGDDVHAPKLKPSVAERLDAIERSLRQVQQNVRQGHHATERTQAERPRDDKAHTR